MGLLDGKVAVITGAGSGMAKASVKVFVREGAKVVAADFSGGEKDTAAEFGAEVLPVHCDVTSEADVEAVMQAAVDEFGRVDVVCNVAGIADAAMIADVTMAHYDKTMDVDLRGLLLGMKHGIRAMLDTGGGAVVNWSSIGGLNAAPYTGVYSAAKAGVIALTKAAAVEYGARGIRANVVCPGFIHTEGMGAHPEHMPGILEKAALNRGGQPAEVAEVAAFLASDRASFVTGAVIPVDGGWAAKLARDQPQMKPAPFEYHAPATMPEAVTLVAELGDEAKVLAGGQSLVPMLALRLAVFDHLVDVGRIAEMKGIERRDGALWIGAGTTQSAVGANADVGSSVPLLARATPLIAHFQIRNRGTLGGSIAHADPAGEYPAVALALDASMEVVSADGRRSIPARDFFEGFWSTSMRPDELLAGVTFPIWSGRCGFAVEELARRHGDFAIAGAVIGVELDAGDRIRRSAIGLIGLGSTPERSEAAERAVVGEPVTGVDPEEVGRAAMAGLASVPSDLNGSAAYRTHVGAAMVARAWARACAEALDA